MGYSDARYRTLQTRGFPTTGALNGTAAAAATLSQRQMLHPVRIISANAYYTAGGTDAGVLKVTINKSLAGTGAATVIGTLTIGTQATASFKSITITETNLTTGDVLLLQRLAGTSIIVADVLLEVGYREEFSA